MAIQENNHHLIIIIIILIYSWIYSTSVWSFMGDQILLDSDDNNITRLLLEHWHTLSVWNNVSAPAICNSPGFGFCLSPLCPLAVCVLPPEEGECMRKASFVTLWSCIALTWERLRCGIAPFWPQPCTALLPTQSMVARGPPLLDGC